LTKTCRDMAFFQKIERESQRGAAHRARNPNSTSSYMTGCSSRDDDERRRPRWVSSQWIYEIREVGGGRASAMQQFPTIARILMASVLITSANRGLGFEFAKQYAEDGWRVYAACRDPASASQLQRLAHTSLLSLDVTDLATVKAAARSLDGQPIDVLLNSAGITGRPGQTVGNLDYDSWAKVLDVNTLGPTRVAEAFADHVASSNRKLIVTITSGMGSIADNTSGGSIAYRSSKAAVNMVMRTLAIDLAPRGISCVLVNPGWVRTDMGGPSATLSPAQSVKALRRLIEGFGPAQSGRFFHYDGHEYAW
jgi:NAD(P)-dependent dehydrogenase (short-subunit alcohol dehydrogenase family)